ncbi:hypothetical protein BST86_01515 [Nonlabens agnitus]|uniref:Uncharacterized protein n=1 Tax=Nonlabens agnitus TaxID=870484 RepID=A0A2S9WQX1_9FLAO|nr:hypothetical protein BST86_01515 [Nonlabens agnitus]
MKGAGIAGIAIGTLLVAPMVQKMKAKKLAEKNKKTAAVPTKKAKHLEMRQPIRNNIFLR